MRHRLAVRFSRPDLARLATRASLSAALTGVACLPAQEKTRCHTTADCSGTRACVDGLCTDETCTALCEARCASATECNLLVDVDCQQCASSEKLAMQLGIPDEAGQCHEQLAALQPGECAATRCALGCQDVCTHAQMCESIFDLEACVRGCIEFDCSLGFEITAQCEPDPVIAVCYELRGIFGPDVLCNAQRPCETTGHPCTRQGHCCGFFAGVTICAGADGDGLCSDTCIRSVECESECCLPVSGLGVGACGFGDVCL